VGISHLQFHNLSGTKVEIFFSITKKIMNNFSNIKERIFQLIEYKGINKRKFYLETGVSNGVLDKKGGYSLDTIEKIISTYSDINLIWLLTGKGAMTGPVLEQPDTSPGNKNNDTQVMLNLSIVNVELAKSNTELVLSNKKLLEMLADYRGSA
jgi:hypothetical protein